VSTQALLPRLLIIVVVLLAVCAAFAYAGGWLAPGRLTPDKLMQAFAVANGEHPGFRRNHAKGVCIAGFFESNGSAASLSSADVFKPGRVPVLGRLALAGGMPMQADAQATVRSMALRFLTPSGAEWRTGMNNIPVFAVNSAQGFYDQLIASRPDPATGKPDPKAMERFRAQHPEAARALALIQARPISTGFADSTFNSLDAFRFVDPAGRSTSVRWAAVPLEQEGSRLTAGTASVAGNYLFDDLIAQVRQHPLQWHLVVTLAQAGDPTDDATIAWPADRRHVDAGIVVINSVESEDDGSCTDINFDPLVLPPGIEPSDDPLLSARSAAYSRSFTLRAAERKAKQPSAVGIREVRARDRS
jgi:catalase